MKQSAMNIGKANRVTIITLKKISMTSPSVQAQSQILTQSRRSDNHTLGSELKHSSAVTLETQMRKKKKKKENPLVSKLFYY